MTIKHFMKALDDNADGYTCDPPEAASFADVQWTARFCESDDGDPIAVVPITDDKGTLRLLNVLGPLTDRRMDVMAIQVGQAAQAGVPVVVDHQDYLHLWIRDGINSGQPFSIPMGPYSVLGGVLDNRWMVSVQVAVE